MAISHKDLVRIVKFGLVGCSGLVLDFSITWFFKEWVGWDKYAANVCGFSVAVVNNYLINRIWTFKSDSKNIPAQFSKFLLTSLAGLGINTCLLFVIHQKLLVPFYLAKIMVTVLVFIWNYTINSIFTFNYREVK